MNITIISGSETGGAGYAAKNLHQGLLEIGVTANFLTEQMIVEADKSLFKKIKRWWLVRKDIKRNYKLLAGAPTEYDHFSFARTGYHNIHNHPLIKNADVINIHWVSYMVDYKSFFNNINKPIIWTLHDTNPFTGGCHYTFGCDNFTNDCSTCPQLAEGVRDFAAPDNLKLKRDSLAKLTTQKTVVVSPSKWLKALSEKSSLFKQYQHFHIPYGINTAIFKHYNQIKSRLKMGFPADKFIVLFAGTSLTEYRKGFDVILNLRELFKDDQEIMFIAIGKNDVEYEGILNLGYISDKNDMAIAYSAANVFIIPSREDNLPNTMLESLCCGTPVIGYKTGGIVDSIEHGNNGFLVDKENVTDIAAYIKQMMANVDLFDRETISAIATKKYSLKTQAFAYRNMINNIFGYN